MEIKDSYILEAEHLLFKGNGSFDQERIEFIKDFSSFDLLAVPGSGKTTALNAKLYCISKNLPLPDGAGILVLSHTNAAVDEVKKNLQVACPEIFQYPNFVGTIQEFVDSFLALPYYHEKYGKRINCIDDAIYYNAWESFMDSKKRFYPGLWGCWSIIDNIRLNFDDNGEYISDRVDGERLELGDYKCWNRLSPEDKCAEKEKLYKFLLSSKRKFMTDGICHFDDCYYFANKHIVEHPDIKNVIRKRFRYVFVDEAQDMSSYQLSIIDAIFHHDSVVLQRIGDPNQSIYSSNGTDCDWNIRNPKYLNKSLRLTADVANIVDCLVLNPGTKNDGGRLFEVSGTRQLDIAIPPVLILYDDSTESSLKESFYEEISVNHLEKIPESKNGFHVIGWNASATSDEQNRRLEVIFPDFKKDLKSSKQSYDSLSDFINTCRYNNTYKFSQKTVKQIVCKVLRVLKKLDSNGRQVNIQTLYTNADEVSLGNATIIEREILSICTLLVRKKYEEAYDCVKNFIVAVLPSLFDVELTNEVYTFLEDSYHPIVDNVHGFDAQDLPISIGTVHSVKGMTHCATMYVETYYHGKYECERIIRKISTGRGRNRVVSMKSPLFKDYLDFGDNESIKKTLKMMYVGFSRPTHLLCYASHIDRWNKEYIQLMISNGWKIKNISNTQLL